jgi:hypothetical protein
MPANSQSMASGDLMITLSRVGSFRAGRHGRLTMRKLLTLWIALAAIALAAPAYADSIKLIYDFGPAFPERLAIVMLTCKTCHGARSVSINGVDLRRDVTSGGAEVAEIWSAPLPEVSGELEVTVSSDHALADAEVAMGAADVLPTRPGPKRTAAGQSSYSLDTEDGDVIVAVSRGEETFASSEAPFGQVEFGRLRAASWNIKRTIPAFTISGPGSVSAVAIYR